MTSETHGNVVSDSESVASDAELDYVSPFRDATAIQIAQKRRMARFPTISATSGYSTVNPSDLGYKTLDAQQPRAKDIAFPAYLTNNEKRQALLLEKLKRKESYLKQLRDSQVITDLTVKAVTKEEEAAAVSATAEEQAVAEPEDKAEAKDEPEVEVKDEAEAEAKDESEIEDAAAEKPELATEPVVAEVVEPQIEDQSSAKPEGADAEQVSEGVDAEATEAVAAPGAELEAELEEAVVNGEPVPAVADESDTVGPPIDPLLAPRVPLPVDADKSFKIPFFKSSSQPKVEYPLATPETPEEIVKTENEGYMNKAVYDKVQYETKVHKDWIVNFNEIEEKKYYDKKLEYSIKLKGVQAEIDEVRSAMEKLKEESQKTLEICDAELTRKMLENTQIHVNKKHNIFRETEFLKEQKVNEKNLVITSSAELQKEIDALNVSKSEAQAEYIGWSNRIADLSAHVDAKVAKLHAITEKSNATQAEIDRLNASKKQLNLEIEENKAKHEANSKVVEEVDTKQYLPKLNDIDNQISALLAEMALIKQESANEKCELSAVTKKIEDERRAHEEKLKLEAEERQRKEEDLLNKQRLELEASAEETRVQHEEELGKLKETYEQLELRLQEQEAKNKELEELQEQEKLKAVEKEKEAQEKETLRTAEHEKALEQERSKTAEHEKALELEKLKASEQEKALEQEKSKALEHEKALEQERAKAAEHEKALAEEKAKAVEHEKALKEERAKAAEHEKALKEEKLKAAEREKELEKAKALAASEAEKDVDNA